MATSALVGTAIFLGFGYLVRHEDDEDWVADLRRASWQQIAPSGFRHLGSDHDLPALVMFADFACPTCKSQYPKVLAVVRKSKLRFVLRYYPHESGRPAYKAALAAESQGDENSYWRTCETLMSNWFEDDSQLYAALDRKGSQFATSAAAKARVESDLALAQRLAIHHTPTYILCDSSGLRQIPIGDIENIINLYLR